MLFITIRLVLWLVVSFLLVRIILKSRILKKKAAIIIGIILSLTVFSLSAVYPLENIFTSFSSPENLFNYACVGKIEAIVSGKESCMVVYSNGGNNGNVYLIPEKDGRYIIPNNYAARTITQVQNYVGIFTVYSLSGCGDCYLLGVAFTDVEQNQIFDSNNDIIKVISINDGENSPIGLIMYAYIESFTEDYYLYFNGSIVSLTD